LQGFGALKNIKDDSAEFQKQKGPHPVDTASSAKYF